MTFQTALTVALLLWAFPPNGVWWFAFLALAPWGVGVCTCPRAWVIHWSSFLGGWIFYLIALRWLMPVTGIGYAALGFYLALYWPMAAWAIRAGLRHGITPIFTLPAAWVATEYLRAWVMSGFPWFLIGHALHNQSHFVQISDLTGAYGVSFLAIAVAGVLVEWRCQMRRRPQQPARPRQLRFGAATVGLATLATLGYGAFRIHEYDSAAKAGKLRVGPKISVIQEYYPLTNTPPYSRASYPKIFADYVARAADAARDKPDLVVFPETAWGGTQNRSFLSVERRAVDDVDASAWNSGQFFDAVISALCSADYPEVNRRLSRLQGQLNDRAARMKETPETLRLLSNEPAPPIRAVVGSVAIELVSKEVYPPILKYNSALFYDPTTGQREQRYDKIHLVPFGELVPFRNGQFIGINLHPLYRWLNSLSPFSQGGKVEYTLTPGAKFNTFALETERGLFHFGVPICYEDVMPYISRGFVWGGGKKSCDFLVNISNDGWFRENELPQHLAICTFRAIENRVPIARSVNTGISAFIDSNGRIHDAVEVDGRRFGDGVVGHRTATLLLDDRDSFYGRVGDWFARLCLATGAAFWLEAIVARWLFAIRHRVRRMTRLWRRRRTVRAAR